LIDVRVFIFITVSVIRDVPSTDLPSLPDNWTVFTQGAFNSGIPGKLREFFNSGNLRENSGNFKFTQGIFVSVIMGIEFCA